MGARRKIGLFLHTGVAGGFRYSRTLLEAVASFPQTRYETVVAYASPEWLGYLKDYDLRKVRVNLGLWNTRSAKVVLANKFLLSTWTTLGLYLSAGIKTLHDEKCDLWVFSQPEPLTYQAGVPALGVIHDLMHRYEPGFPEFGNPRAYYRERHFRAICHNSVGVLVDSEVGKQQVYASYGLELSRIHVLPYVAPKYIFRDMAPDGFEERYRLPEKFIFYPAHFWEHKNHKGLIKALATLQERLPDLQLVLVGLEIEPDAHKSVVRLVNQLGLRGRIHFFGFVSDDDIPEFYRRARAMIMPTFAGPTNIPPLEAFATGCPVAISNVYGTPQQVGDAALLFDPKSETAIAEAIHKLWTSDDLCRELVAKGTERSGTWGQKQFSERLLAIVDQVLRSGIEEAVFSKAKV